VIAWPNLKIATSLVLSHLSYLSNRSYVFHDLMFNETWEDGVWFPLNTFISGPTAGGPFPHSASSAPRAISHDYWSKFVPMAAAQSWTSRLSTGSSASQTSLTAYSCWKRWADKLKRMPDSCIEIAYDSKHIIDYQSVCCTIGHACD